MNDVYIVSAKRSAIGSFMGGLKLLKATEIAAKVIGGILEHQTFNKEDINEVILGQVLQGGAGQAPARQASLGAGLSASVPCTTINKVCGSGLKAVMMAADSIRLKNGNAIIAGGMESMSNAPYIVGGVRDGLRMGNSSMIDLMLNDGLFDPYGQAHMGSLGDMCAREHSIDRVAQDDFSVLSYEKALVAQNKGKFDKEIVPIKIKTKNSEDNIRKDEEPLRFKADKIPLLKPAFGPNGTITAANASKINDGASALLVSSLDFLQKNSKKPLAKILSYATYAAKPEWFTTAPIDAMKIAIEKTNLGLNDIDLFEINEAFAVVPMMAIKKLSLNPAKINVHGGAIALGHPIGCSGARILTTLVHALYEQDKRYGLASICLGGGEAVAMIIERGDLS